MRFNTKDLFNVIKENEEQYVTLIKDAQAGNNSAFAELFHRYRPLVRRIWQKHFIAGYELADWEQDAQVVLIDVLALYQDQCPQMFSGFFKQCLTNRIRDIRRQTLASKRIPAHQVMPMDTTFAESFIDSLRGEPDEIVYCHQSVEPLLHKCSPFECQVLSYLHQGYSISEAATRLNCSKRSIQSAVHRCREKMLAVLAHDY